MIYMYIHSVTHFGGMHCCLALICIETALWLSLSDEMQDIVIHSFFFQISKAWSTRSQYEHLGLAIKTKKHFSKHGQSLSEITRLQSSFKTTDFCKNLDQGPWPFGKWVPRVVLDVDFQAILDRLTFEEHSYMLQDVYESSSFAEIKSVGVTWSLIHFYLEFPLLLSIATPNYSWAKISTSNHTA